MSFPLTIREARQLKQAAIDATKVWAECPDCEGTGDGNTSGDPQNGFFCPTCKGEGDVEVCSIHLQEAA